MSNYLYHSPLGIINIHFAGQCISSLQFVNQENSDLTDSMEEKDLLFSKAVTSYLDAYFLGKRPDTVFDICSSGSQFHQNIMNEIRKIPYGQTITYQSLAEKTNQIKAVRAVANTLKRNQVLLINPCHRIIGKADLGGYLAGKWRKKFLLALEGGKFSSLGLNSQDVHLNENKPVWKELFEIEKEAILSICPVNPNQIEHIGSTYIPDFISKPIIDIMLGIDPKQEKEIMPKLLLLGWQYKANFDPKEWHYLAKGTGDFITHHLHVCHYNSKFYKQHIAFRDILIANPDILNEYEKLKKGLKADYAKERKAYTNAKTDFVYSVLKKFGY